MKCPVRGFVFDLRLSSPEDRTRTGPLASARVGVIPVGVPVEGVTGVDKILVVHRWGAGLSPGGVLSVKLLPMRPRTRVPESVEWLLDEQDHVITRAQARSRGLTDGGIGSLVDSGRWHRLSPGVYSSGLPGWRQFARAGVLIAGPGATLGGAAAAHLMGLAEAPRTIDVWSTDRSTVRRRAGRFWRFRRGVRSAIGSPPHTSAEEAILDLCAEGTTDDIAHWLSEALHHRRTTVERLAAAIDASPKLPRRGLIAETLQVVGGGSHSPMEVRFQKSVEVPHGLPTPSRQQSYSRGTSSDMGHDAYKLLVELDGKLGHRGPGEVRDARRDADHLAAGFATLRFCWSDVVDRPCETAAKIATVLRARGWTGTLKPCPRCRVAGGPGS